ncbi:hypothetical protein ZIOFF_070075 [Zingiber officinale]|uniref:peptidylprolyl isomerase n=1 Tax=Zingiber officinale TaxID=94328 RepID=A0A8J5C4N0_ZINOF|nr:hypothetical protein ZIOFF_070075 [Zingiber officinale]
MSASKTINSSGNENRRDKKWSSRWGPADKEKRTWKEKRMNVEKEDFHSSGEKTMNPMMKIERSSKLGIRAFVGLDPTLDEDVEEHINVPGKNDLKLFKTVVTSEVEGCQNNLRIVPQIVHGWGLRHTNALQRGHDGQRHDGSPVDGPILKVGEEKEIEKERLKKKLVKEGEGWGIPKVGDKVEVHYIGALLDGTKFDSSFDQDTPFKFKLGQGQVIKGWDQGIKTMKKGENAIFTIPPDLAYGESSSPPTIPPNATMQFDVELLSWSSIKGIIKDKRDNQENLEGVKFENPKDLDEVLLNYEARLEDGTVVSKSEEAEFTVKDGYFIPSFSKAVKTMKKAEKLLHTVKLQYAFAEKGRPAAANEGVVPPNATLQVELELVSWKAVTEIGNDKKITEKDSQRRRRL